MLTTDCYVAAVQMESFGIEFESDCDESGVLLVCPHRDGMVFKLLKSTVCTRIVTYTGCSKSNSRTL